jgi:hypothetical protein
MQESLKNQKTLPWIHHYIKFGLFCGVFWLVPALVVFWYLYRVFNTFSFSNDMFLAISNYSAFGKLGFWLCLVFVLFGFFVIFIHYISYFTFEIYAGQIRIFFRQPDNRRVFYKMDLPVNYNYNSRVCGEIVKEMYLTFLSKNITWSTVLNYGKYHHCATFDYIVEDGAINSYVSFPFKKQILAIEIFKKHLPEIKLTMVKDPFATMPAQWSSDNTGFKYSSMAGSVISHSKSAFFGDTDTHHIQNSSTNISDLLDYLSKALPNNKVVLQYVFTFDSLLDPSIYYEKYAKLASDTMYKYSPSNGTKKTDTNAFEALVPKYALNKLHDINQRLLTSDEKLVRAGIKIVSFCSDSEYVRTEKILDKAIKAYFQENSAFESDNKLEKSYLTATNQTYYNHSSIKRDEDERAKFMYERMVYLPTALEPYFASLYNQFYYPKENEWRRKSLYTCFKARSGYKPLTDSLCILEFDTMDKFFQIPVIKSQSASNIITRAGL